MVGRFFANLYECLCCPDPCYQPSWIPEANAAFFVDYARPQTVTRFRYDYMPHLEFPDRAEYWWAQSMYNYKGVFQGKGPKPPLLVGPRGNIVRGWSYLNMNVGSFYTEAAAKRASFFVEIPYESFNAYPKAPNAAPNIGALRHAAGFSDMNIGTKSLLFDCELIQLTFQFRTYLPIGNFSQGLGNGHVSLEPSLLDDHQTRTGNLLPGPACRVDSDRRRPVLRRRHPQVWFLVQSGALPLHPEDSPDRHLRDGWLVVSKRPLHQPLHGTHQGQQRDLLQHWPRASHVDLQAHRFRSGRHLAGFIPLLG